MKQLMKSQKMGVWEILEIRTPLDLPNIPTNQFLITDGFTILLSSDGTKFEALAIICNTLNAGLCDEDYLEYVPTKQDILLRP